jgi:RNA polymerase sigma-70 factor, ECF subfamily
VNERSDISALLLALKDDDAARARLIERVYAELRRVAQRHLRRERARHSLSPTALVHETYLKLVDQRRARWENRAHFFSIAAHLMRRILVDHARARTAGKRRAAALVTVDHVDLASPPLDVDILALDEALVRLARSSPRQSELVELRFFAGLNVEETAAALGVAPITVKRDWAMARAWLFRELRQQAP